MAILIRDKGPGELEEKTLQITTILPPTEELTIPKKQLRLEQLTFLHELGPIKDGS